MCYQHERIGTDRKGHPWQYNARSYHLEAVRKDSRWPRDRPANDLRQGAGSRADLLSDLGAGEMSTQKPALVDLAVKTDLMLVSTDNWILMQPSLINARRRALLPVVH